MALNDTVVFHTNCITLHCEIRGVVDNVTPAWTDKNGKEHPESHSLILKVDDDNCDRIEFIDRDMSHQDSYKRGQVGTLKLRVDMQKEFGNKYTTQFNVIAFIED